MHYQFKQDLAMAYFDGCSKKTASRLLAREINLTPGRREEVRLTPSGHSSNNAITHSSNHTYTLDLSSRPQATYLLTLTTADGKQHTLRLMKMSDIFSR
jgi:hypothetical protein